MTTAEIKEILNHSRHLAQAYNCAKANESAYRLTLTGGKTIRYDDSGGTHEKSGNPVERSNCRLLTMSEKCDKLYDEWKPHRINANRLITLVSDDVQREVLTMYYIRGMSWHEIARRKKKSVRWVHKLHGYALLEISKST